MIRRFALVLIALALIVVPTAGGAARGPLPTAGIAYIYECRPGPTGACAPAPADYVARFAFFGSVQLDGGSRLGFWGLRAVVTDGAFGPTPITDEQIEIPFPAGVCALDICLSQLAASSGSQMRSADAASDASTSAGFISNIGGSCSGQGGAPLWNLTCNFVMPGGLSATRKIQVVLPITDVTDLPCQSLCEPSYEDSEWWGVYMRNIPGV